MNPGVIEAIRGCQVQQIRLETIANNLANVTTTGFKKDTLFMDEMAQVHTETNVSQGNLRLTGNPLDVALSGEGFFKVSTENGIRYTRNGRFLLDSQGGLVTAAGDPVMGDGGPIMVEKGDITVDTTGKIYVDGEEVDTLSVVIFDEPEGLFKEGQANYIYQGEGSEVPPEQTNVMQNYLEESNVVVTEEMVKMIETLRQFESYQKVLQTFDEADGKMINDVGKN